MAVTYKDWHEMLYALHGYQRLDQLNLIEEKRLATLCHGQLYQRRIKNAFDKKARPRAFKEGDMVLKKIFPNVKDQRGKWAPNYEGPCVSHQGNYRNANTRMDAKERLGKLGIRKMLPIPRPWH
ncbi:hypothetical protein CR513_07074, partial [Mucuna pruriens]